MTETVLESLRETSKGKLVYDPFWFHEGRSADILRAAKLLELDGSLLPLRFEDDVVPAEMPDSCKETSQDEVAEPSETKPNKDDADDAESIASSSNELAIKQYEEERLNCVREALKQRLARHEQQMLNWQRQAQKHILLMEHNALLQYRCEIERMKRDYIEGLQDVAIKSQKVQEHHKNHARHLRNKIKEAELRQKQLEEEERKREVESKQRAEALSSHCREMELTLESVRKTLRTCQCIDLLNTPLEDHMGLLDRVAAQVASFGALSSVSRDELAQVLAFANEMRTLVHAIVVDIEQATAKGLSTQKLQRRTSKDDKPPEVKKDTPAATAAPAASLPAKGGKDGIDSVAVDLLKKHSDLVEKLDRWQASYQELVQDKKNKKYCFDLVKAVTIPVNALANSLSVQEKLDQLSSILSGKSFQSGPRTVSCLSHSLGLRFCLDKLAEKIVLQGEEQINVNADSAFPLAALALGLWYKFPDIGDLLLAHFYMRCPALVPVFFARVPGRSEAEHLSLCGYKSDDNGVLETETKFNKRIAGLVRLYAAMIQTPSPPWDRRPHLLGVNRGWHWLAAVTRASPEPNLACTILFNFLEVAGWALGRDYGLQFRKALHMLCKDVFPRLKRESATTSGPVARLEGLLQETLRRGHLPKPQGCLGERVWD